MKLFQLAGGDLEWIGKEWRGFRFFGRLIYTDNHYPLGPGDLRAYPYLRIAAESREHRGPVGREWFLW
ncbi:MAG TPA: hypothetical protein ENI90_00970 [Methylothermaceae bacterium]|nr:hypothetical protein [Methylothermaceae bacterium]